jgi:Carboxypeptidase regulatory-like domain
MSALKPADEFGPAMALYPQKPGVSLLTRPPWRNFMTMRKLVSLSILMLALTAFGFAQSSATGDLHVTVKDPKGSLVTNATVTARDPAKGVERPGTGNGQGEYRIALLPPGTYQVTAEAAGFAKTTVDNVVITVGELADLPITLAVAGTQEVVNVNSSAELVETTRTSTTDTIGQARIDNLPINGRNYINFALTDSQVLRDNAPSIGAAPTSGLNISGQRARSNLVNVDGANAIDNSTNGVRSTVSQEAVQEFQIITNSYAAEYGQASGGVINIITRSGSNQFHGDVYGYLRDRDFQATNPFSNVPNPAYTRVQAGTAFGGPIRRTKLIIISPTRSRGGRKPVLPASVRTTLAWYRSTRPTSSLPALHLPALLIFRSRHNKLPFWEVRDCLQHFCSNTPFWWAVLPASL